MIASPFWCSLEATPEPGKLELGIASGGITPVRLPLLALSKTWPPRLQEPIDLRVALPVAIS